LKRLVDSLKPGPTGFSVFDIDVPGFIRTAADSENSSPIPRQTRCGAAAIGHARN